MSAARLLGLSPLNPPDHQVAQVALWEALHPVGTAPPPSAESNGSNGCAPRHSSHGPASGQDGPASGLKSKDGPASGAARQDWAVGLACLRAMEGIASPALASLPRDAGGALRAADALTPGRRNFTSGGRNSVESGGRWDARVRVEAVRGLLPVLRHGVGQEGEGGGDVEAAVLIAGCLCDESLEVRAAAREVLCAGLSLEVVASAGGLATLLGRSLRNPEPGVRLDGVEAGTSIAQALFSNHPHTEELQEQVAQILASRLREEVDDLFLWAWRGTTIRAPPPILDGGEWVGGKALEHPCGTLIFDPERDGGGAQRESSDRELELNQEVGSSAAGRLLTLASMAASQRGVLDTVVHLVSREMAHAPPDAATQAAELFLGQHAFPLSLRELLAAANDPGGGHAERDPAILT
ncbi:hypothetical protein T484DRAFT_1764295 [Baffinella frigidus]|nr:hypothetical protein T484DRAFT_1764295 [Cryptophyta sp. CCMP2293]